MYFNICIKDNEGNMIFHSENISTLLVCPLEQLIVSKYDVPQAAFDLDLDLHTPVMLIVYDGKSEFFPLPYYSVEIYL